MAAASGAFNAKCGFNQSGGAYYLVISSIQGGALVYTAGSGSGGATTTGTFATFISTENTSTLSTVSAVGSLIKDLGKTVVSSGRTFRRFQGVVPTTTNSSPTFGVGGATSGNGYLSFYLEVGRDGANLGAKIARYA